MKLKQQLSSVALFCIVYNGKKSVIIVVLISIM